MFLSHWVDWHLNSLIFKPSLFMRAHWGLLSRCFCLSRGWNQSMKHWEAGVFVSASQCCFVLKASHNQKKLTMGILTISLDSQWSFKPIWKKEDGISTFDKQNLTAKVHLYDINSHGISHERCLNMNHHRASTIMIKIMMAMQMQRGITGKINDTQKTVKFKQQ